jgi:hypothetical protein
MTSKLQINFCVYNLLDQCENDQKCNHFGRYHRKHITKEIDAQLIGWKTKECTKKEHSGKKSVPHCQFYHDSKEKDVLLKRIWEVDNKRCIALKVEKEQSFGSPTKLAGGPTKLAGGPTKLAGGPTKLAGNIFSPLRDRTPSPVAKRVCLKPCKQSGAPLNFTVIADKVILQN